MNARRLCQVLPVTCFHQGAIEFLDAISYYETASPNLGQRFKTEAARCLRFISEQPQGFHLRPTGY